ncbi:ACT domain-containing protein [Streptomyces laurentii]|uniref:ACT domain-containing protein n=1 Tax=Streptomyces laurentii TaxID=39478 RepID=UPI00340C92F2
MTSEKPATTTAGNPVPERNLSRLLAGMRPELHPGRYVFTTLPGPGTPPAGIEPVVMVAEPEGLTLVVRQEDADAASLAYDYVAGWITLRVHSALDAVGLTAAVATALADAGLSCNVVAGFHHDHLFVERDEAERALAVLEALSHGGREATP